MKLKKCLDITKSPSFCIFVYPKGHTKEKREMCETPLQNFDVHRSETGELPELSILQKYADYKVKEIIPLTNQVNIVVEE